MESETFTPASLNQVHLTVTVAVRWALSMLRAHPDWVLLMRKLLQKLLWEPPLLLLPLRKSAARLIAMREAQARAQGYACSHRPPAMHLQDLAICHGQNKYIYFYKSLTVASAASRDDVSRMCFKEHASVMGTAFSRIVVPSNVADTQQGS